MPSKNATLDEAITAMCGYELTELAQYGITAGRVYDKIPEAINGLYPSIVHWLAREGGAWLTGQERGESTMRTVGTAPTTQRTELNRVQCVVLVGPRLGNVSDIEFEARKWPRRIFACFMKHHALGGAVSLIKPTDYAVIPVPLGDGTHIGVSVTCEVTSFFTTETSE